MTKVLITGADGFTGRYLSAALLEQNHEVIGVSRVPAEHGYPGTVSYVCDLTDINALKTVISDTLPDKVVHLAAVSFVAHSDISELYQANIVGTRNLLEGLASAGKIPDTVLVASSANVYGNGRTGVLHENTPLLPANDYGVSKMAVEALARIYSARLPLIVMRPFNYTGRGQSLQFLIPKIIDHFVRREKSIRLGNIEVARDFSDVRTVVDCYVRLLGCADAIGGTFNICSGSAHELRDIISIAERLTGHSIDIEMDDRFVRHDDVRILCGDKGLLEKKIGSIYSIPLEDTLSWMLKS